MFGNPTQAQKMIMREGKPLNKFNQYFFVTNK